MRQTTAAATTVTANMTATTTTNAYTLSSTTLITFGVQGRPSSEAAAFFDFLSAISESRAIFHSQQQQLAYTLIDGRRRFKFFRVIQMTP